MVGAMITAKALDELQLKMQQWRHHASQMRRRADACPAAAKYYYESATYLMKARSALKWAILEESAVEK